MTVEEIFTKLASHMIKGLMIHEELANYYDFLSLKGYQKCHQYHYLDESWGYRKLFHYYVTHFSKLIIKEDENFENFIPQSWYFHEREDVDCKLRRESIKKGMEIWIAWEKQTKCLYEEMFQKLLQLNKIETAMFLKCYIEDVGEELKKAQQKYLELKAIDYDILYIMECQQQMCEIYKQKIQKLEF